MPETATTTQQLSPVTDEAVLGMARMQISQNLRLDTVRWVPAPGQPNLMLGVVEMPLVASWWFNTATTQGLRVYAVTLLHQHLTSLFSNVSETPIYDAFWLTDAGGQPVLGTPIFAEQRFGEGVTYLASAVVLCAFYDISTRIAYEQALSQAKAEAISANQAKSRFLAAVSHEMRTPLYGIVGTMELLALTQR